MNRLFLLDGMALIYRAHFALIQNPIRNSKGVNTSALYGFINTLLAILEKEKPTHIGVAFDTSAPTPRHVRYPAYKAQRDEMPEELAASIPHVKALCEAFHIPVLVLDGFEADDIIGTLVKRADDDGFESFMVTPDKDFAQLISPTTCIWKPGRKGSDHEVIGLGELEGIWGVSKPEQIIDLLGLMGDAVDNIPGVPGIGPKTAQKLIAQFGSVENLLANTSQLKGKQKENVVANSDQALLSKELATIIRDVPIDVTWGDLELSARNDEAVKSLFTEFEFRTLTKRLFGDVSAETNHDSPDKVAEPTLFETFKTIRDVEHTYHLADTPEKQAELFASLAQQKSLCFDIESTSLHRFEARLLGIAFSWKAHEAWYLPYDESQKADLTKLLGSRVEKIGHNLKYDLCVLLNHGIQVAGPLFDTMLADTLIAPDRKHSMDYLSEILLGYTPVKLADLAKARTDSEESSGMDLFAHAEKSKASKDLDIESIPLSALAEYAAEDADVTFQIAEKLRPLLEASGQQEILTHIESPLLPVLVRMEMEGIEVDKASLSSIGDELLEQIEELAKSIHHHADRSFNIASPKQLGEILFDQLQLIEKPKKTKTGQYKTDEQTLASLEGKHPIIGEILAWREATKLKSTYLDALPNHIVEQTGRIHTHYHQLLAATGRLASSDPNLQNIPVRTEAGRKIRKAFVPRKTDGEQFTLLSCDYSQIELRVMAALANDSGMIAAFRSNADIHTITSSRVFGVAPEEVTSDMRRTAKMVNFGIIYGISAFGLSQRLSIPRTEAASIIEAYFREYPAIEEFMDRTIEESRESGYVETLTGRRRYFPDLRSGNQNLRGNAERAAINSPIQGTSADMIKLAMIRIDALLREKPYQSKMLLQVHDELIFDLAIDEKDELVPRILEAMKTSLPLPHEVPIEVEYGTGSNWLAAH
ncbi:DNA polymerase I [Luteolibacter pohnpeiensis]|uniref:DNA polymerase I n=1 Tax=Luteolibacter pohnpeiensis TaxID=454153 RepID=A0A934VUS1_9BACT|nr:DNA polymerase I [Luteolibacter pohnpeiensis]MBK1880804.1 DNA polymerase I [Luteolibacter pohnpeiensis]